MNPIQNQPITTPNEPTAEETKPVIVTPPATTEPPVVTK